MIFSIAMGADYSFYVKTIATYAPHFLGDWKKFLNQATFNTKAHQLGINYYVNFLGRLGSNGFQLI